ncbi:MAG: GNAT family N-acetyltransferase [Inquilinaceae bacterium]
MSRSGPGRFRVAETLDTKRLRLRQFGSGDIDAFAAQKADPEAMRFIGAGTPASRPDAWRSLAMIIGHWTLRGYGLWAVEDRSVPIGADGARPMIGHVGLFNPEGWPGLEIGWALDRAAWGRGLATEAALAVRDHAFARLGVDRLISVIQPGNARSIAVAERIGGRLEREATLSGRTVLIYAVGRGDVSP